ncbi:hypothetical protein BDN67DRAFT_776266 [Paxillus ammoniavirescens]|nr:hypothetical protein BDN67DRAFT_776266 [Paxillus ammoniavirescens]
MYMYCLHYRIYRISSLLQYSRCLLENETACPLCTHQHGVIQEIRRNNQRLADQHDSFLADVDENGFRAIAGGSGRGWLGVGSNVEVSG